MRIRNFLVMLIALFTLFHFNPQYTEAEAITQSNEETHLDQPTEETDYIESSSEVLKSVEQPLTETTEDLVDDAETKNQSAEETNTQKQAERDEDKAQVEDVQYETEEPQVEEKEEILGGDNEAIDQETTKESREVTDEIPEEKTESEEVADELREEKTEPEEATESEIATDEKRNEETEDEETTLVNEEIVDTEEEANEKEVNETEEKAEKVQPRLMAISLASVPSNQSFKEGDQNDAIIDLKKKLNAIGFGGISETNYFGDWTSKRVTQFQEYYGLSVNGKLDHQTVDKLNEVYNSPFQYGKRHDGIPVFKEKLNKIGYDGISLTNFFGSWSETRLKQFQKDHGLRVNGIGDSITLQLLNVLAGADSFKQGDRHHYLSTLKEQLNHVSFDGISETTYFGNWTTTRVKQFQEYYGLTANGKLNAETIHKLDEVYNSPFQLGKRHKDIPDFKRKLNKIGYDGISLTNYFGNWSETRLEQFQKDHGLRVNGIGDSITLKLLNVLAGADSFKQGDRHHYLSTLKEQLNHISFDGISETTYFGNWTTTRVEQFQEYYGLTANGKLNAKTIHKLDEVYDSPFQLGKRHKDNPDFKRKLNKIGYDGISLTNYFGNWSETRLEQFQKDHGLRVNGIGDSVTLKLLNVLAGADSFKQGDRHQYLSTLKKQLNRVGFDRISETDYFGNWTTTRVKQFQSYYGLRVNGKLNAATINKLDGIYNSPFQLGKSHKDMPALKKKLNKLGYNGISLTNYFGNWSDTRLKQFQKDHNLIVNGIADDVTQKALENAIKSLNTVKIFIDPGHGGKDSGARGYGLNEKDVVLDIARAAANVLRNNYSGVEVMLSRTTDKYLKLSERTQMANSWGADYFISIHNNAFNGSAQGFESYVHNNASKEAKERQKEIHNYIATRIDSRDRGMKTANFHVVRESNMPAILIEYLFIDHPSENALLKQKNYRQKLGKITANAIASSFDLKRK